MSEEGFYLTGEEVQKEPIRYRACGLDGIYLYNGYRLVEHDGEDHLAVTDIEGLHQAIGRHLVMHRKGLSPKEIRFLRNTMNLTQEEMAQRLGNNAQSVARWEKGETEIPGGYEKLLRAVYLASLMTDSELAQLREFLVNRLNDLDQYDESHEVPAQFQFCDHWTERQAA